MSTVNLSQFFVTTKADSTYLVTARLGDKDVYLKKTDRSLITGSIYWTNDIRLARVFDAGENASAVVWAYQDSPEGGFIHEIDDRPVSAVHTINSNGGYSTFHTEDPIEFGSHPGASGPYMVQNKNFTWMLSE